MNTATPQRAGFGSFTPVLRRYAWFEGEGGGNDGGSGDDGGGDADKGDKKLSQSEVDKLIGKTRTDTRKTAQQETTADILKRLGVEKLEDAESILKAVREKSEAEKTELQKAQDALAAEQAKAKKAADDLAAYQQQAEAEKRDARRDSAIKTALDEAKAKSDKVLALLKVGHADAITAVLKEDGTVDEAKVKALVETARKAWPEDFGKPGVGSPSLGGGRAVDTGKESKDRAQQDLRNFTRSRF